MRLMRRPFIAVSVLALAIIPMGCNRRTTTSVSVLNSSTTQLRVNAWLAGEVEPGAPSAEWDAAARSVEPGGSATIALERPSGADDPAVVVRLVTVGFDEANPYWIRLEPPGPFILRVRGDGGDLTTTREQIRFDENQTGPGGIPLAPGERSYRGSLPPWVAR